jgi:GalNAc5-diNAcBac-PP-undecaprenol beta-1,3-glucosyltransferase
MTPLFSVIIPTHNRPLHLKRAIQSVKSSTVQEVEIIVISDSCNYQTNIVANELLNSKDIFIKRNGNPGPALSRNMGLELAKGVNIIFLDDDDSFDNNYLENISYYCDKNKNNITYSNFEVIEETIEDDNFKILNKQKFSVADINIQSVYVKNFIHNHTTVFPRVILKNKYQDIYLSSLDDWDFLLNAHQNADLVHADIFGPRIHKNSNLTGGNRGNSIKALDATVILDYLSIYKKFPCAENISLRQERVSLLQSAGFKPYDEWI